MKKIEQIENELDPLPLRVLKSKVS